jgi:hypothetical protein
MEREEDRAEAEYVKDQVDGSDEDDLDEVLYMFCELSWPSKRSQNQ